MHTAFPGVGCDKGRVHRALASSTAPDVKTRFFVGEAEWMGGQLEEELAQGTWLLLSPEAQYLQDLSLKPHGFCDS